MSDLYRKVQGIGGLHFHKVACKSVAQRAKTSQNIEEEAVVEEDVEPPPGPPEPQQDHHQPQLVVVLGVILVLLGWFWP